MALARNKPIVCPVLIGRAADLTALYVLVDQAKRGEGQVVLINGEAGIGKSRLVAEAKAYAASQGFFSLQGNCFQTDSAFPYAPFLDLLRSYFSGSSLVKGHHNLAPFAQELSQFLPDVIPLNPESTHLVVSSAADPQQEKRRLFSLLLHFFTQQSTHQPLLFIVEDLHWSDDTSLELLLYLARGCRHLPILFVLTYRSDEVSPELRHCLAEFDREHLAQDLSLQRLDRSDVDAMLQAIFAMHEAVHTGLAESVYALTEGNPFFVEEVLKSLIATGEIASKNGAWERTLLFGTHTRHPSIPRSVQDAVYQRTNQLSAPARQVLRLSAVAGRRFDLTILQQVMHADESHMLVLMKELVAAQFVTEEAADQFSFRHALTRQAIYSELLAGERRALHRTLAETIEQRALPSSILDAQLVDLAYHFYKGEVWSKAAEYGQRAGERALILYAPRAAIEHFTRVLAALKCLGSTPSAAVVRARGQAYETIGAFEQARADYEQALSIAHQTQDGAMEWQSLLDIGCLWAGRDYAQAGQWFRKALERAQVLADPKLHARSLNRIGNWLVNIGRAAESLQTHQEALAIFEALQDTQGMAETFDLLGMASGIYGDTMQAVEHYERAIALFRSLSDQQGLISSLATRAAYSCPGWTETTYSVCEPPERCSRDIMETLNLARQVEALIAQTFVSWNGGGSLASFGELGRGFSLAQEALHIATEIQHVQWLSASYFTLGRVYYILLEANLAVQAFETGLRLASDTRSAWWIGNNTAYLARAYLLQGALTSAEEALKAVMPREQPPANTPERRMSWAWGELALASDEPEIALGIADRMLASAPGAARAQPIPWLLKLKGEALGALSRREEAIQALEEATQGALARQERPLLWQLHRSLGRQYHSLKQEDLAQRNFTSARQVIASLASTIDDVYLSEHFLHAALATLPREKAVTASRVAKEAFGGLTEREREVAALIAQGKSNREIADKLVVSYRTVETHVGTILSKLAFSSRAQIAVWAVEIGLVKQAE
ncbi:MAG TPA: AAA family ATPase [Ktedonobacteraceae bacterium]|nr:AAA family ATPase [Ktedonobacteraceae bacterium]